MITENRYHKAAFDVVRETGLEPVRHTTHAPQTCLSANSSTRAFQAARIIIALQRADCQAFSAKFEKIFLQAASRASRSKMALSTCSRALAER